MFHPPDPAPARRTTHAFSPLSREEPELLTTVFHPSLLYGAPSDAIYKNYGNTAQFGKRLRREILFQDKVWKTQEYCMYFKFFKLQDWDKRSGEGRRRNCAVLP